MSCCNLGDSCQLALPLPADCIDVQADVCVGGHEVVLRRCSHSGRDRLCNSVVKLLGIVLQHCLLFVCKNDIHSVTLGTSMAHRCSVAVKYVQRVVTPVHGPQHLYAEALAGQVKISFARPRQLNIQ